MASEEVHRLRQTVQLTDAYVFKDWCAGASLPAKIRAAANLRTQELGRLRAKHDFVNTALVPNGWSKVKVKHESMRYASSASTTTAPTSTTFATSNATSTGTTGGSFLLGRQPRCGRWRTGVPWLPLSSSSRTIRTTPTLSR